MRAGILGSASRTLKKVRRAKALLSCRGEPHPAPRSLQPEAIPVGREETVLLKPATERNTLMTPRTCRSQREGILSRRETWGLGRELPFARE